MTCLPTGRTKRTAAEMILTTGLPRKDGGGEKRAVRKAGFTLLELILVMMIAAIVLSLAAPSLRIFAVPGSQRTQQRGLLGLVPGHSAQDVIQHADGLRKLTDLI